MKLRNGAIINDRYIIEEKIGSGGMAIVYRASDTKLDRTVTLKVMREDYIQDDEFIDRFYTEAQAAARLNHPNIVKVYDVDRIGDILFIVMEYIDGITLKEAIRARGKFTNEEVLGVSVQIASAIDCAHKNHIIHRDIKPQNILLTHTGEVKVTDFGIARAANAKTTTATSTTLGSVHYFSPEQARGGYVDHKSDIYALGITMFEMASGQLPFDDETVVTIALKHINDELPNLRDFNPKVSDSVVRIIDKATEKSQIKRYESADIMGNDLKRALTNQTFNPGSEYDSSLTQTLKISREDMNKIKAKSNKKTEFKDINDDYRDDVKNVKNTERRKYQDRQKERLRTPKDERQQRMREEYDENRRASSKKLFLYAILTGVILTFIIVGSFIWGYKNTLREKVDVPNLVNMSVEDAEALGEEEGFKIEIAGEKGSDIYTAGLIMEQDFQPGNEFYSGGTIKVIVSAGDTSIPVPDVTGKTEEEAIEDLENLGFEVRVKRVSDDVILEGIVVEQIPSGSSVAEKGSLITIYVSTGTKKPEQVVVPNVVGISEASAISQIENSGLVVKKTYKPSSVTVKGNVISQSISAGQSVDKNSELAIVVSSGTEEDKPEEDKPEEDNPAPTDNTNTQPVVSTKTIVVNQSMIPSGYETVGVKVVEEQTGKVIYEKEVGVNDFPINITVSGTGVAEYSVYTKVEGGSYSQSANKEVNFDN